jgi:hypothetical protein
MRDINFVIGGLFYKMAATATYAMNAGISILPQIIIYEGRV